MASSKLDNLNRWLTLIANVGVLVGLVFLAIEIRHNTNVAQASAYRELTQDISEWRTIYATNPDLNEAYANRHASEQRPQSLGWMDNNIVAAYENAYFAWRLDVIGESEWQRFKKGACFHWVDQAREEGSPFLSQEFEQYMMETCRE